MPAAAFAHGGLGGVGNIQLRPAIETFDEAPTAKNVNEFNTSYDNVVNNYNYMITAYNTNINVVNSFKVY